MRHTARRSAFSGLATAMLLGGVVTGATFGMASSALAACPAATVADMMGVKPGKFPQQYDLAEFEAAAGCKLSFTQNPAIAALNGKIKGNPDLPNLWSPCPMTRSANTAAHLTYCRMRPRPAPPISCPCAM